MKKIIRIVALLLVVFCMAGCRNNENLDNNVPDMGALIQLSKTTEESDGKQEENENEITNVDQEYAVLLRLNSLEMYIDAGSEDLALISNLSIEYIRIKLTDGTDTRARESLKPYKITNFGKLLSVDYKECLINANNIGVVATIEFNNNKYSLSNERLNLEFSAEDCVLRSEILLDKESGLKIKIVCALESIK